MAQNDKIWTRLQGDLADLEVRRRRLVNRSTLAVVGALALVGFAVFGVPIIDGRPILSVQAPLVWGTGITLGVGLVHWVGKPLRGLQQPIKSAAYGRVAKERGYGYASMAGHPSHLKAFEKFKLVRSDSDYRVTTDRLTGVREGLTFDFSIVKLSRRARTGGAAGAPVTIFHGVLMTLRLPRALDGVILLRRDHGVANSIVAMDTARIELPTGPLQPVQMSDPAFERVFEVFANDPEEAEALLSPTVRRQFLKLNGLLHGTVRCALRPLDAETCPDACELLIVADVQDWFHAPSMFHPVLDPQILSELSTPIDKVEAIIDVILGPSPG